MPGRDDRKPLSEIHMIVDQPAIDTYARITDDFNPIHIDPEFAAASAMGGIIAHGTMSLGLLWQMISENLDGSLRNVCMTIRFVAPVRPGDRIVAGGSLDNGKRHEIWVRNQKGETVIQGHLDAAAPLDETRAAA